MSGESIVCPQCRRESFNPNDIREKYCGYCHQHHDTMSRSECGETFCVCGDCVHDGPVLYASPEYLAKHPGTVVLTLQRLADEQ